MASPPDSYTATHFQNTNTSYDGKRSDYIPACPACCDNEDVTLIDVVVDSCVINGGTKPVWHCQSCKKVFGKRVQNMEYILNDTCFDSAGGQGVTDSDVQDKLKNTPIVRHSTFHKDLETIIKEKVDSNNFQLKDEINDRFDKKVKEARREMDDPMNVIRERVRNFELRR